MTWTFRAKSLSWCCRVTAIWGHASIVWCFFLSLATIDQSFLSRPRGCVCDCHLSNDISTRQSKRHAGAPLPFRIALHAVSNILVRLPCSFHQMMTKYLSHPSRYERGLQRYNCLNHSYAGNADGSFEDQVLMM